jgi:hypothetical protein
MYNIVILAEQALTAQDAREVVSLHEDIEDSRRYHVLIPSDDAALRTNLGLGLGSGGEGLATPIMAAEGVDIEREQRAIDESASAAVQQSVANIEALGLEVTGEFSTGNPVDAVTKVVADKHADEVIVMTLPHAVSELFHLDWTSKTRRRLGVPVLHLLEHEPLDAEAGEGQGITGM